jgi:hypothetical protein
MNKTSRSNTSSRSCAAIDTRRPLYPYEKDETLRYHRCTVIHGNASSAAGHFLHSTPRYAPPENGNSFLACTGISEITRCEPSFGARRSQVRSQRKQVPD